MVDGCRSKLFNVVSGVPQPCFGPVIVPPVPSENKLIGYADYSTLIAVVPSPGVRVTEAETLSRDLVKVSKWCAPVGDVIEC